MAVRAVLGRRPSGPRRGDGADRGRPVLGEAHQDRPPRRAAPSAADLQLLLHPPEAGDPARVRARHQSTVGARSWRRSGRTRASSSPADRPRRRRSWTSCATRRRTGARRSAWPTASRSRAGSRSACGRWRSSCRGAGANFSADLGTTRVDVRQSLSPNGWPNLFTRGRDGGTVKLTFGGRRLLLRPVTLRSTCYGTLHRPDVAATLAVLAACAFWALTVWGRR